MQEIAKGLFDVLASPGGQGLGWMQNRYAGDVGDFIKLGLIRHLAAADLSFGVNWYLTPDEAHNADGKHVAYVEPGNRQHASLKACDPDLMERLSRVVAGSRSVQALEDSGALRASALTFGEVLDRSVIGRRGMSVPWLRS